MSPSGRKRCPISIQLYFISIWLWSKDLNFIGDGSMPNQM
jgi:hypothetical protein